MYLFVIAAIIIVAARGACSSETIEMYFPFGPLRATLGTIGLTAAAVLVCELLVRVAARRLQSALGGRRRCLARYRRVLLFFNIFVVGLFAVQIHVLQWPRVVTETLGLGRAILIDDLLVIAPFVVSLISSWVILFRMEVILRPTNLYEQPGERDCGRWDGLREYLDFNIRQHLALFLLLWLVFQGSLDLFELLVGSHEELATVYTVTEVALAFTIYSFAPYAIKRVWRTAPLPQGELRRRLERLCQKTGLKCRDILIWRTGGGRMANAAITGLFGRLRYILLTDALFKHMRYDEIEAIFGHEIGHVKHKHIPLYLMFSLGFILVISMLADLLPSSVREEVIEGAPTLLLSATLYLLMFGFLSRRFERQADVYGAKAVGDIDLFTRALERVSMLNGIARTRRSLRHPSIAKRVDFLIRMRDDPEVERRFQRSLRGAIVICGLIFCAAAVKLGADYISKSPPGTNDRIDNTERRN